MAGTPLDREGVIAYVRQRAPEYGLDPAAVLAVGEQEGMGGGIGDTGTSFGPWQLHVGGAFPGQLSGLTSSGKHAWAWSTEGVDYALGSMSKVASGLTGGSAISSLVQNFERPREDLRGGEIARAQGRYGWWTGIFGGIGGQGQTGAQEPAQEPVPSPPTGGAAGALPGAAGVSKLGFGDSLWHVLVSIGLVLLALVLIIGGVWLLTSSGEQKLVTSVAQSQVTRGAAEGA